MANVSLDRSWPVRFKKELDKEVVGQNAYKETIIMGIYRQVNKGHVGPILVVGPTGSGKTFLLQCVRKSKLRPDKYTVMMTNVSRLTEEGIKGPDIDDIFREYAALCKAENNTAYRGMIYLDEVDKIIGPCYVSYGNGEVNRNAAVQHQLMQVLDGGTQAGISTENILFVFGGAFHQLDACKKEEIKQNPIGFCAIEDTQKVVLTDSTIREQMIGIGFQREFLGRISQVVELEALKKNELLTILMHPSRGVISKLQKEYASDDIELQIKDEAIEDIVNAVIQENLGARSVRNIVEKLLCGAWYKCIENGYDRIIVDKDTVVSGEVKYEKSKQVLEI